MNLEESLRALAADEAAARVPPHVDAAVMAAWDARHAHDGRALAGRHRPVSLASAASVAAVCAASIAAFVAVVSWPAADEPRQAAQEIAGVPLRPPAAPEAAAGVAVSGSTERPAPGRRARARSVAPAEAEAVYVLVPDAGAGAPPLTLMRVRMARREFSRLGVPITNPDGDGLVDVEVLVGEDGVARSIRRAVAVGWADSNP